MFQCTQQCTHIVITDLLSLIHTAHLHNCRQQQTYLVAFISQHARLIGNRIIK